MEVKAQTVAEYVDQLPEDRKPVIQKLRETILQNLPKGFEEGIGYNMIGYVVPLSLFPAGYHCSPNTPLPFLSLASQKNFVALYHMGIYGDPALLEWFITEFPKHSKSKLDMGKSCIRFKKMDDIPYDLIAELCRKITPEDWMAAYERILQRK